MLHTGASMTPICRQSQKEKRELQRGFGARMCLLLFQFEPTSVGVRLGRSVPSEVAEVGGWQGSSLPKQLDNLVSLPGLRGGSADRLLVRAFVNPAILAYLKLFNGGRKVRHIAAPTGRAVRIAHLQLGAVS